MKQFGNDVICIDATHSTNICNFLLITIMVMTAMVREFQWHGLSPAMKIHVH